MTGPIVAPDQETLQRLRRLAGAAWARHQRPALVTELVALAGTLPTGTGLTIDLTATSDLGQPLVIMRPATSVTTTAPSPGLSRRESEVAALIVQGLRNKEIADRLVISVSTVKDHVHRILEKTGLSGRAALIAWYLDSGYRGGD